MRINLWSIQLVKEEARNYPEIPKNDIANPDDCVRVIQAAFNLENADREHFGVICLNIKSHVMGLNIVSIGSLNSTLVHPREVFKPAILANSAKIILFHNHPSGDTNPSEEDLRITDRLKKAGKILGIEVLDHIVIGQNKYTSFRSAGLWD